VEHSPEAQRRRCAEYAHGKGLDAPRFLSDEGRSGKDLDRPAMQELIALIEADQVAHLIVWRIDRLSRDSGDVNHLLKLFERHCVTVHSLNEGNVESITASGRFTAGLHGLLAQLEREKIIENVKMGMEQAARAGYWLNTPPTGYDLVDRVLVPNDDAHLVRRAYTLRAAGQSYSEIERAVGLKYSTVRHLLDNRVYLGLTRLRDQWFPGRHEALITEAEFDAAHRGHVPGRRRGSDLLTGRVRCGMCGKLTAIDTNRRGQPIYRCRHRGKGCRLPGRSAAGLHRAARLGIELLRNDDELIDAIRAHLIGNAERAGGATAEPSHAGALTNLRRKRDKLLELFLDDKITEDYFGEQERALSAKIKALETDQTETINTARKRNALVEAFERAAALLRDPAFDFDAIWDHANDKERRVLIEELIEAVTIHADRIEVTVTGAPPLLITPGEVGLQDPGTGLVVSEGGLELRKGDRP
jgi:DNA invertase Pin-like site-specific DNA recombinase